MSTILLFNVNDAIKKEAIRLTSLRYGIELLEILPSEQGKTLEDLLLGNENRPSETFTAFTDEMLVMHSLSAGQFHGLLDTLRSTGQTVRLKAVVTEHNSSWSAVRLHRELLAEAAAMEKQTSLKRQSSSHSKRRK